MAVERRRAIGEGSIAPVPAIFARAAEIQDARTDCDEADLALLVEVGAEVGIDADAVVRAYAERAAAVGLDGATASTQLERWVTGTRSTLTGAVVARLEAGGLRRTQILAEGSVWAPAVDSCALGNAESVVLTIVEHDGRCLVRLDGRARVDVGPAVRRAALRFGTYSAIPGSVGAIMAVNHLHPVNVALLAAAAAVAAAGVSRVRELRRGGPERAVALRVALGRILDDVSQA